MPRLWVPDRTIKRVKPPLGAEVDWGHPLARDLRGFWVLNEAGGWRWRDLCYQANAVVNTTSYGAWGSGVYGSRFDFTAGQIQYWEIPYNARLRPTGELTIVGLIKAPTCAASQYGGILQTGSTAYYREMCYIIGYGATTYARLVLNVAGTSRTYNSSTGKFTAGQDTQAAVRRNADDSIDFYFNGKLDVNIAGHSGAIVDSGEVLSIGGYSGNYASNNIGMYYSALWGRSLSASELLQLYAEPFSFLRVPKRKTYVHIQAPAAQATTFKRIRWKQGPRVKPPVGAEVDWSHPLARGLRSCYLLHDGAGLPTDLVNRYRGVFTSTVEWRDTAYGKCLSHSSNCGYVDTSGNVMTDYPFTMAWMGSWSISTDAYACAETSLTDTDPIYGFRINSGGTANKIDYYVRNASYTGGTVATQTVSGINDDNAHLLVGASDSSTSHRLYIDGSKSSSGATSVPTPFSLSTYTLGYLHRSSDSYFFSGKHILAYRWTRALSAAEALWLYAEPFAFLRVPKRKTYVHIQAPAAAATTFKRIRWKQDPRVKPPVGAEIDWGHPLTRNLVGCWDFGYGGALLARDLGPYKAHAVPDTKSSFSVCSTPFGPGIAKGNNWNNELSVADVAAFRGSCMSGEVYFKRGGASYEYTHVLDYTDSSLACRIYSDSTTINCDRNDQIYYHQTSASVLSDWMHLVWTDPNDGATAMKLYLNGKLVSTAPVATQLNFGGKTFSRHVFLDTNPYGYLLYARLWGRCLSAAEALQLYAEPFSFLSVPKRRTYWVVTGGAGDQTVNPAAAVFVPAVTAPIIQAGAVTVSPASAVTVPAVTDPTIQGAVTVSPSSAVITPVSDTPTIQAGAVTQTPAAAVFAAVAPDPTLQAGAVTVSPASSVFVPVVTDPSISGSVTVSPAAAVHVPTVTDPTLQAGAVTVSPASAVTVPAVTDPTVFVGTIVQPAAAVVPLVATDPTIQAGAVTQSPSAAVFVPAATDPVGSVGAVTVNPASATFPVVGNDPTLQAGAVTVSPASATVVPVANTPTIQAGAVTTSPSAAVVPMVANDPTVLTGNIAYPSAATFAPVGNDPTLLPGSVTTAPASALFASVANDPSLLAVVTVSPSASSFTSTANDPSALPGVVTVSVGSAAVVMVAPDPLGHITGPQTVSPSAALFVPVACDTNTWIPAAQAGPGGTWEIPVSGYVWELT